MSISPILLYPPSLLQLVQNPSIHATIIISPIICMSQLSPAYLPYLILTASIFLYISTDEEYTSLSMRTKHFCLNPLLEISVYPLTL